ncbi:uncharacterized protein LOC116346329 [Contarinia nasturtii]|uniref:uncharacterized protein LOC116346329 n=1 Tax=Contarinia nasturtii TaxID=265458 RepID=UPI0012D41627|nr:uncharacterized protein LOC116346329 [Contarinia nasturtii]
MKPFLLLICLAIFIFNEVSSEVTYGKLVQTFNDKAKNVKEIKQANWSKELTPLFTIYEKFTESLIEKIFHSFIIVNLQSPIDNFLEQVPENNADALAIVAYTRTVLMNQNQVNNLCSELSSKLRHDTVSSIPPPVVVEYRNREHIPLNQTHVKKIQQSISYMHKIHKDFKTKFIDELNKADVAKEVFASETGAVLSAFNDASTSKLSKLKGAMLHLKQSQDRVWKLLKNIENILIKYNAQRNAWANFLSGVEGYLVS